jgi:7,8-dihydroneopterin aldolase/epimerase/oxygenase
LRVPILTGRIEIRDLRALGLHGVLEHERGQVQPFSCDVDAWLDIGRAASSDALDDTIDYGEMSALVKHAVAESSYLLIERLVNEIADKLLEAYPRLERVSVTVRKLHPPVRVDVGSIGVTVVKERAGS